MGKIQSYFHLNDRNENCKSDMSIEFYWRNTSEINTIENETFLTYLPEEKKGIKRLLINIYSFLINA